MFRLTHLRTVAAAAIFAALGACGCTGVYENGRSAAAAISPASTWRASGDMQSVRYAIDQDLSTAAVSAASDNKGTLTVDLGKPCLFNMVIIEHGVRGKGFAKQLAVLTGMDGDVFTHRCTGPGTRRVTIIWLGGPVLARYVRLQVLIGGEGPWTVAEVCLQ